MRISSEGNQIFLREKIKFLPRENKFSFGPNPGLSPTEKFVLSRTQNSNNMFTIRKATVDDRFLIHELASRVWENTYGTILSKEQLDYMFDMMYAPENIRKQMEEWHHQFFIISADNTPAGYLSVEKTGDDTYNFQKIYSVPEAHGTGIGRFIIEQGVEYLRRIHPGPFTVELYVNRQNPAVGFYEHMGLRKKDTRDYPIGNGYYMNDYIMEMRVDN